MDSKDIQILQTLQQEGRLSNQDLSDRVNLSPSPCLRRLRHLEETGVIQGYTALVNQKAYGLPLTVFIRIVLERHIKDIVHIFEQHIQEIPEIMECYMITGDADYLLRVICRDLDAYEHFVRQTLHTIPGIASIDTSVTYGSVKQKHIYPNI